jgi:hypothetical protein
LSTTWRTLSCSTPFTTRPSSPAPYSRNAFERTNMPYGPVREPETHVVTRGRRAAPDPARSALTAAHVERRRLRSKDRICVRSHNSGYDVRVRSSAVAAEASHSSSAVPSARAEHGSCSSHAIGGVAARSERGDRR